MDYTFPLLYLLSELFSQLLYAGIAYYLSYRLLREQPPSRWFKPLAGFLLVAAIGSTLSAGESLISMLIESSEHSSGSFFFYLMMGGRVLGQFTLPLILIVLVILTCRKRAAAV